MAEKEKPFQDFYVIGDLHHKVEHAAKILETLNPKKVIWLGDFMDSFGDTPFEAMKTGVFLKNIIETRPNDIFILSNHDISYRFPLNPKYHGYGFSPDKCRSFHAYFDRKLWNKFKLFHFERYFGQNIVFSHAGFTANFCPHGIFNYDYAKHMEHTALERAGNSEKANPFIDDAFGILWKRWPLMPVTGICQVVGHTPQDCPTIYREKRSSEWNLNLDCVHSYIAHFTSSGVFSVNVKTFEEKRLKHCTFHSTF